VPPPPAGGLTTAAMAHLETSLKFMHVTAPVRVMSPGDYRANALDEYGLDPPRYTIALYAGGQRVLDTRFGRKNPQEIFQYVKVAGRDELYLLPVFVGREWELVAERVTDS